MIVFLAGPIEHWWDGNWHTRQHLRFIEWRQLLSEELVRRGHLVYRPHEAFKGAWEPNGGAQAVNDRALELADLVIVSNFLPPVRCNGTRAEVTYLEDGIAAGNCHAELVRMVVPDERILNDNDALREYLHHKLDILEEWGALIPPPALIRNAAADWDITST